LKPFLLIIYRIISLEPDKLKSSHKDFRSSKLFASSSDNHLLKVKASQLEFNTELALISLFKDKSKSLLNLDDKVLSPHHNALQKLVHLPSPITFL
jgi:hypothetical protein